MPRQQHYYGLNHAHFLTASTYRRARLFDSNRLRLYFVQTLGQLQQQQDFRLLGWVLMPEHFHLLLWPSEHANPSQIIQSLKERTAKFALLHLRRNSAHPWCARMLKKARFTYHRSSPIDPSRLAKALLRSQYLEREKAAGKTQLHARQSGETRTRCFP